MNVWKIAIGVVAIVALAAGTVGFVGAQTDGDGNGPLGGFVSRLAGNLGITEGELETAIDETQLQIVDEKLADGQITEEQAASARERIESGEPFLGPLLRGKHQMHDGEGHQGRPRGGFNPGAKIAEFIGVTPEELRAAVEGGQSVVQVAEANGVSEQALTEYLLGQIAAKVAEEVEAGKIDPARAEEFLANAAAKISERINRAGPPEHAAGSPDGGPREGGFGSFPHPRGDSTGVTEAVSPTF